MMAVFAEILAASNSKASLPYEQVLAVDKRLEAAHDSFTSIFRMKSFSQSITDPIDLIMQRYWLELLYQKARPVLHRKFLGAARLNSRYAYSRWACIDAATRTLQHQYDIHMEIQPGGRLARERWFISSLSTHDFLLADMILCLELSYVLHTSRESPSEAARQAEPDGRHAVMAKEQLLEILATSRSIWQTMRGESAEANRAFKILTRMLTMSTGNEYDSSPDSSTGPDALHLRTPPSFRCPMAAEAGTDPNAASPQVAGASVLRPTWTPSAGWATAAATAPSSTSAPEWDSAMQYMPASEAANTDDLGGLIDLGLTTDWVSLSPLLSIRQ